jgi:hypothetical protein
MGADPMDPGDMDAAGGDPAAERPYGTKPYGTKPYGTKPYGTKPYGTKPYGTKPYGTKPYGTKPYGTKPYGTKPYGTKPYGTKPYGTKPYGTKGDGPDGWLDPEEWSADIAELFCDKSAVVRLGAHIVEDEIDVPAVDVGEDGPRYLERPSKETGRRADSVKPSAAVFQRALRPRDHELAWTVVLPNHLTHEMGRHPELAWAIKEDIAQGLALEADRAFLNGDGNAAPRGISHARGVRNQPADALRGMLTLLRTDPNPLFGNAGWIIAPETLDAITVREQGDRTWDSTLLVVQEGADGGTLLGYPFVASAAARDEEGARIFLSADWSEAWVGISGDLVSIDISTDAGFQTDETVVRAVMCHDFVVRRPEFFVYAPATRSE